jgi:hypothetical protein
LYVRLLPTLLDVVNGARPSQRPRNASAAGRKRKVAKKVAKKVLLDWVTPLGKQLRFCTGTEVAALGSGFTKLAEKVPADTMVGEVLTEAEVQAAISAPEAAAA